MSVHSTAERHHVEVLVGSHGYGWHCVTCGAQVAGMTSSAEAEAAGRRHADVSQHAVRCLDRYSCGEPEHVHVDGLWWHGSRLPGETPPLHADVFRIERDEARAYAQRCADLLASAAALPRPVPGWLRPPGVGAPTP
ncbi:MAG: hypothetical protein JWN57_698, partial [Frankiales bacterium]|nr:hypothetical protein [Frankiales bacterium]